MIINNNKIDNIITKIMDITKMSKKALLDKCKECGITKCSTKNKLQLIEIYNNKINNKVNEINDKIKNENINNVIEENIETSNIDLLFILNNLIDKYTIKILSNKLNLSSGTLIRWIQLNDIPKSYEFDLLKLSNIKINYSNYSSKQKDQFFTPINTAQYCFNLFCNEIHKYNENENNFIYIEPSAGDGNFLKVLPLNTIAMDIDPKHISIIEQDYLDWKPIINDNKYIVFGNPPFGLRGHMALKFINHSYEFADYVCFILPQLFESDGKGVPRKRVKGFNLIYSIKIETNFYEPDNNELKINTIFQIWSKYHINDKYDIKKYSTDNMKIYSMSNGGTVASTRNKNMIDKCDIYIPSTCFGKENMKYYLKFEELPGKKGYGIVFNNNKTEMITKFLSIKWNNIAFLSTNSAYNLRSSQIYSLFDM